MTPVAAGIICRLVEGPNSTVVCRDGPIREQLPIELTPMDTAICAAPAVTAAGPGELPSGRACFPDR